MKCYLQLHHRTIGRSTGDLARLTWNARFSAYPRLVQLVVHFHIEYVAFSTPSWNIAVYLVVIFCVIAWHGVFQCPRKSSASCLSLSSIDKWLRTTNNPIVSRRERRGGGEQDVSVRRRSLNKISLPRVTLGCRNVFGSGSTAPLR